MEILTLALLKAVATTCIKIYLSSLLGGGGAVVYRSSELGYKVPKWYSTQLEREDDKNTRHSSRSGSAGGVHGGHHGRSALG